MELLNNAWMRKKVIENMQEHNNIDLRSNACWKRLGISSSSFFEIKFRLGYKGKHMTIGMLNEIEEIVKDIRKRDVPVTTWYIIRYFECVRKEK